MTDETSQATTQANYVKEVAIAGLVLVELAAIYKGMNGVLLTLVVAAIAGIVGYKLSDYVKAST